MPRPWLGAHILLVQPYNGSDLGSHHYRNSFGMSSPRVLDPAEAAESNLGRILGVNGTFHFIAIVFVALRVYTRVFLVKTFGVDDVLIILAIVSTITSFAAGCYHQRSQSTQETTFL